MNKPASKEVMGALHDLVATSLAEEIKGYTDRDEPIPPALLGQAIKFLKDNGIEAVETPKNPVGQLAGILPFPTDQDLAS